MSLRALKDCSYRRIRNRRRVVTSRGPWDLRVEYRACGPSASSSGESANLTTLGVCATASPSHPPWKSPLPGRCLAEFWLLHPHKMHPIKKRGDEPSEEHTERRSELPPDETTGRPTERTPRRTTARPTDRAAIRPTHPSTDGAFDSPCDGTHDRASGRPHARPLDRAIELRSDRRCGRPSELTTE